VDTSIFKKKNTNLKEVLKIPKDYKIITFILFLQSHPIITGYR